MCNRAREFDVRHALTTNLGLCNFNATLLADNTTMLQSLVLATQALVILDRTKDFGAKQAIALWFERPVVDRFRLLNFTERPGPNHIR